MAFLDSIGNAVSGIINTVTDTVGSVVGGVADTAGNSVGISGLGDIVQSGFDTVGHVGTSILNPIGTVLGGASSSNYFTGGLGGVLGGVGNVVGGVLGGVGNVVGGVLGGVGNVVGGVAGGVGSVVGGVAGGLGSVAGGFLGGLPGLFPGFTQPPSLTFPPRPGNPIDPGVLLTPPEILPPGTPPTPQPGTSTDLPGSINQINNMSLDQLQSSTDALMNKALSGKELTKNEQLALQQEMQRMNELFSLLSNLLKMQHDTSAAIIGNMR